MDSNFESQSPDNADKEPSFRKPSNDKANRKYRRHSSVSGSMSSSSDGSPKRGRSPSPAFSREDLTRTSRKNGGKELDMEPGRSRYDKGGDSHRHSDRTSYRSSRDYHKHDDYERHHKRADEGERSYHRSSGSHRESRSGSRSDRTRHGSEHDKWGDYRRNTDKYAQERSDDKEHRDKNSTMDRRTADRRHTNSSMDDSKSGGGDRLNKDGGGQDDIRNYGKRLTDSRSSFEEATGHGRHSSKESGWSHLKESQEGNTKDPSRHKGDTMERRKHEGRESDKQKEKFSRESAEKDYGENELRKDFPTHVNVENESSAKKLKMFTAEKEISNSNEGKFSSAFAPIRPTVPRETTSKQTEASPDLDAAKVAAMKAAELVNRNLVGSGYMSTDQKKKLLWGSKKTAPVEESGHRWNVPLFSDTDRQEKFKKLMSLRLRWCLWRIVGCERRFESRAESGEQQPGGGEAGAASAGFGEAVHCWASTERWSYCWTWPVIVSSNLLT